MDISMQEAPPPNSMLDTSQAWQDRSPSHQMPKSQSQPQSASFTPLEGTTSGSTASEEPQPKKKGRKGHSKSRTGCFNCKRARIKCKENRPACDYCAHRDLRCEWPELKITQLQQQLQQQQQNIDPSLSEPIQGTIDGPDLLGSNNQLELSISVPQTIASQGPVFNMQDFRLFNYFREHAYPHHPIGNDSVWRHEIPCIASNYDFLLHSMLGLSASELACSTDPTPAMHSAALTHRVKAIACLNTAIGGGISNFEQGNAMLAACFSLLFQSCLLEDGLVEYMMFIRGTVSIGWAMGIRHMRFLFERLWGEEQVGQIDPLIHAAPLIQAEVVAAANRSFERFKELCQCKVERDVYGVLSSIARALTTSSRDAYMNLRKMYELFSYTMTQPEFQYYCNTSNLACQLLQAHFVALQLIMAPVTRAEFTFKEMETGKSDDGNGKTVAWLVGIHRRVPRDLKVYFSWTMWVEREVLSGKLYSGRMKAEDLGGLNEVMKAWNEDWSVVMNVKE